MNLSTAQENAILSEYLPVLVSVSHRFCNRYTGYGRLDFEDCLQECCIVFLKHLRTVDTEEHIWPLPFRDFHHALCLLVLGTMPCSVPRRTAGFRAMLDNTGDAGSLDGMLENGIDVTGYLPSTFTEVDERLSFERFLAGLSDQDRAIVDAMMRCGSITEASQLLGVNKSTVSRNLARMKSQYLADCTSMNGGNAA